MIFKELDHNKIVEEIEKDDNLDSSTFTDIKSCVWILGFKYVERDYEELEIIAVEREFNDPLCAGTIDLIGRIVKPIFLPSTSLGKTIIFDWKTTGKQDLDTIWKNYYIPSWQWKIYSAFNNAQLFEYRGISKSSGETKEILLDVPKNNAYNVNQYLTQLEGMKVGLYNEYPWPQHMPYACTAYGKECQFYKDCLDQNYEDGQPDNLPFHYTSSETFLLCPEKFRREQLLEQKNGRDKIGSEETRFGSAVHRGMAEIYKQLMERQK